MKSLGKLRLDLRSMWSPEVGDDRTIIRFYVYFLFCNFFSFLNTMVLQFNFQAGDTHTGPIGSPALVFWSWKAVFELYTVDTSRYGSKQYSNSISRNNVIMSDLFIVWKQFFFIYYLNITFLLLTTFPSHFWSTHSAKLYNIRSRYARTYWGKERGSNIWVKPKTTKRICFCMYVVCFFVLASTKQPTSRLIVSACVLVFWSADRGSRSQKPKQGRSV